MAIKYVDVEAACTLEVTQNSLVYLCLANDWADKTVSGWALLEGTVVAAHKKTVLSSQQVYPGCNNPTPISCVPPPPTCADICVFQIAYNDDQVKVNIATGLKYELVQGDVKQLFPYGCTLQKALAAIDEREDWVVDHFNITSEYDGGANSIVYTIPIRDRISNEERASFDITFPVTILSLDYDNAAGVFDNGHHDPGLIDFCALIVSCFDGDTIVLNGENKFEASVPSGIKLTTVTSSNNCGAGGIGADYMVKGASVNAAGTILTINSAHEHTTVHTDSPQNTNTNVTISSPTGTVLPGTTLNTHLVVNNPSACRQMRYTAFARAQLTVNPVVNGTTAGIIMQLIVNAGSPINVLQVAREVVGGGESTVVGFPEPITGTIAAAGSVTFASRAVSNSNGVGNSGNYAFPDINFIGNTL